MPDDKSNEYLQKYLNKMQKAETETEKSNILDKIYSDGFEDGAVEGTGECKRTCVNAGMAFADLKKGNVPMFPINVRGLVSEDDLKVPASELAMHAGAAGKELLAWSITDNYAHIIYEKNGCCEYAHGLPSELLSSRIRETTKSILGK